MALPLRLGQGGRPAEAREGEIRQDEIEGFPRQGRGKLGLVGRIDDFTGERVAGQGLAREFPVGQVVLQVQDAQGRGRGGQGRHGGGGINFSPG